MSSMFHPDVYLSLALEGLVFNFGCKRVFVVRKWLVTQTLVSGVKVIHSPPLGPECFGESDADPEKFTLNVHQTPCASEGPIM